MREGWEIKKLGELGKISMCKRILKKQTTPIGDIPFYKIGTFGKIPNAFISKEVYEEYRSKYSFPKKGDILLSASGTIGRRVIYDGKPAYFQDSNIVWIDNNEKKVLNDYLYKFYGFCNWNPSKGATISRLYNDDLRKIKIPIPPLPEQKRIVSILDRAFEAIDKAKANAEQNLKNAKELFESYLQRVFENKGSEWEKKKLNEVVIETCNLSYGVVQPGNNFENGLPVVRPVDLKSKFVKKDRVKLMNPINAEKYKRTTLQGNELLLCVRGDTGVISLITDDFKGANVTRGIVPVSFDENQISLQFGYYSFISSFIQKQIKDKTYGAALMQINIRDVRQILMIIPSLKEQKQIVQKLDTLSAETKKLEAVYLQKLNDLEELRKSVLQKAFNGQLSEL